MLCAIALVAGADGAGASAAGGGRGEGGGNLEVAGEEEVSGLVEAHPGPHVLQGPEPVPRELRRVARPFRRVALAGRHRVAIRDRHFLAAGGGGRGGWGLACGGVGGDGAVQVCQHLRCLLYLPPAPAPRSEPLWTGTGYAGTVGRWVLACLPKYRQSR